MKENTLPKLFLMKSGSIAMQPQQPRLRVKISFIYLRKNKHIWKLIIILNKPSAKDQKIIALTSVLNSVVQNVNIAIANNTYH